MKRVVLNIVLAGVIGFGAVHLATPAQAATATACCGECCGDRCTTYSDGSCAACDGRACVLPE